VTGQEKDSQWTKDFQKAVVNVFVSLYENNLIYKGTRMVNWDTKLKSAVSDLEVTSSNESGKLWTIKYKQGTLYRNCNN
jgi:valyl-tRNA synthetase